MQRWFILKQIQLTFLFILVTCNICFTGREHSDFPSIKERQIRTIFGKHDPTQKWTQSNGAKSGSFHLYRKLCIRPNSFQCNEFLKRDI